MEVTKSETLYVRQLAVGPMKNFVYLVGALEGRECFVVDPAWDVPAILAAAETDGRAISAAFVTHHHHDHVNGVGALLSARDVPLYAQAQEIDFATHVFAPFAGAVKRVAPGEALTVAGVELTCLHTPGHTPGSHCLHCHDSVFTGDTLFVNACGRCDFEGSDAAAMHRSLFDVLGSLNSSTRVYSGHDYGDVKVSTLAREKQKNPWYQLPNVDEFIARRVPKRA